ncbi:MAG: hypothetical protein IJR57_08480 [Ruminococcus sp.]|nr:hypothetical protein [Ruminococcus sp.]
MKPEYKRENLKISEFDTEDVIMTSGQEQHQPMLLKRELENAYGSFDSFNQAPGSWF